LSLGNSKAFLVATFGGRNRGRSNMARVLRGGSWFDLPRDCRSAGRNWLSPVYRYYFCGFRVVVVARTP
jgi:formylglycine-generating enzyme required for sulfatase activity